LAEIASLPPTRLKHQDEVDQILYGDSINWVISQPLDIHWSIIQEIVRPNIQPDTGHYLVYLKFDSTINLIGTTLLHNADFALSTFNKASFYMSTFNTANFSRAKFNTARFPTATFNKADFSRATITNSAEFYGASFKDLARFSGARFHKSITLEGLSFGKYVDFSNLAFFGTSLDSASVAEAEAVSTMRGFNFKKKYTLTKDTIEVVPTAFLQKAYFADDCSLRVQGNIPRLGIGLEDWNRIWIAFNEGSAYIDKQRLLNDVIKYVNELTTANRKLRDDVLDRLDYQLTKLEMEHGNILNRARIYFFELIAKNGYRGTWNFVITVLSLVLLFTIVYYRRFQDEIDRYIYNVRPYGKNTEDKLPHIGGKVLQFLRNVWFSLFIFITFKFNRSYFHFPKGLQATVVTEWVVGLIMLIIYFFHFSSKYAFIKALLGI